MPDEDMEVTDALKVTDETPLQEDSPHSHLLLIVHGIGAKKYEKLIANNGKTVSDTIEKLLNTYYPEKKKRPMVLPVNWRTSLELDKGLTKKITLPRIAGVRDTLNGVAMDIIYYQSPLYRTEIMNGLAKTLNDAYAQFMAEHPSFKGEVSIMAHSLGSVAVYDILTQWTPFRLYDEYVSKSLVRFKEVESLSEEEVKKVDAFRDTAKQVFDAGDLVERVLLAQEGQLRFKVDKLFCVGSPLAVYLIMRGGDYKDVLADAHKYTKGRLNRIYNIFHPNDPIAYRLEPLFHEHYANITPVKIYNYEKGRQPYERVGYKYILRKEPYVRMKKEKRKSNSRTTVPPEICGSLARSDSDSSGGVSPRETEMGSVTFTVGEDASKFDRSIGAEVLLDEIPEEEKITTRLDFQVAASNLEKVIPTMPAVPLGEWMGAFWGHCCYWNNWDVAAFILNELYPSTSTVEDETTRLEGSG